jgi:hypothetical protein
MINPVKQIERSAWTKSSFTDGKQISTAKSPMDWTAKAIFDSMLAKAKEKESRKLGAYERRVNHGV